MIATIPLVARTGGMRRKPVFLVGITGFLVANTITAFSADIILSLATRFVAGAFSGLLWVCSPATPAGSPPPNAQDAPLPSPPSRLRVGLAVGTPFGAVVIAIALWGIAYGGAAT